MKPLQYKIWDKLTKTFDDGETVINSSGEIGSYDNDGCWTSYSPERHEVVYSTAQYDKNKKQCFYGDLIQDTEGNIWEVRFRELGHTMYFCRQLKNGDSSSNSYFLIKDFKIVGNKFKNPELISEKLL